MERSAESGTIALSDGIHVSYRPITPEDHQALQRFHTRLSGRSIYRRFFGVQPVLSESMATYFTELDGENRFALVALDPNAPAEIIAVARFDRSPNSDQAEYAAVVADAWQDTGSGSS